MIESNAVNVHCEEELIWYGQVLTDSKGGLYIQGNENLWYIFKGKASKVIVKESTEVNTESVKVTQNTLFWSSLRNSIKATIEDAYETGLDIGIDVGSENAINSFEP